MWKWMLILHHNYKLSDNILEITQAGWDRTGWGNWSNLSPEVNQDNGVVHGVIMMYIKIKSSNKQTNRRATGTWGWRLKWFHPSRLLLSNIACTAGQMHKTLAPAIPRILQELQISLGPTQSILHQMSIRVFTLRTCVYSWGEEMDFLLSTFLLSNSVLAETVKSFSLKRKAEFLSNWVTGVDLHQWYGRFYMH